MDSGVSSAPASQKVVPTGAVHGGRGAAVEGRGVDGGQPVLLELVVEEHQGQGQPGHVEAGDELADLGAHRRDAGGLEQLGDLRVDHEELLVLHRAQAVDDHGGAAPITVGGALGLLGEDALDQQRSDLVGRSDRLVAHTGLAVDAQTHAHLPVGDMEEGLGGAGEGAAVEGDAEGARGVVGLPGDALRLVEVRAGLDRRAGDLEDGQVTGDAAAVAVVLRRVGDDVVADLDDAHVDALGAQLLRGRPEVEDVAGVVAEAEHHAAAVLGVAGHRVHLRGRRRGEDVAARGAVAHAGAHPAGEGGIVAGAPADHQGGLPLRGRGRTHHAAVHDGDVVGVGQSQAADRIGREVGGVVEEIRHR